MDVKEAVTVGAETLQKSISQQSKSIYTMPRTSTYAQKQIIFGGSCKLIP
jgi:hypothetical protein